MSDLDPLTIFIIIVFSAIGLGYYSYGKKQSFYFLICGIGLMVYPYFFNGMSLITSIGILLVVLPFLLTKFFD